MRRAVVLLLAASTLLGSATAASAAPVALLKAMVDDMDETNDHSLLPATSRFPGVTPLEAAALAHVTCKPEGRVHNLTLELPAGAEYAEPLYVDAYLLGLYREEPHMLKLLATHFRDERAILVTDPRTCAPGAPRKRRARGRAAVARDSRAPRPGIGSLARTLAWRFSTDVQLRVYHRYGTPITRETKGWTVYDLALRFASRDEVAALLRREFRSARVKEALRKHHENLVRLGITGAHYWHYIGCALSAYERLLIHLSGAGQEKRAKFPTSKAPISAVFHSFRLIFGRAIISRNGPASGLISLVMIEPALEATKRLVHVALEMLGGQSFHAGRGGLTINEGHTGASRYTTHDGKGQLALRVLLSEKHQQGELCARAADYLADPRQRRFGTSTSSCPRARRRRAPKIAYDLRARLADELGVRLYLDNNGSGRSYWAFPHDHAAAEAAARAKEAGTSLDDDEDLAVRVRRYTRDSRFKSVAESGLGSPADKQGALDARDRRPSAEDRTPGRRARADQAKSKAKKKRERAAAAEADVARRHGRRRRRGARAPPGAEKEAAGATARAAALEVEAALAAAAAQRERDAVAAAKAADAAVGDAAAAALAAQALVSQARPAAPRPPSATARRRASAAADVKRADAAAATVAAGERDRRAAEALASAKTARLAAVAAAPAPKKKPNPPKPPKKAKAASVSLLLQESRALGLDLESHEDDARYIFVAHVHDGGQCAAALARQRLESADLLGARLVLVNGEATWALTPDVLQRTLARQRPLDLRLELELPPRSPRRESTPQQPLPLPASLAFAPALSPYGYPPAARKMQPKALKTLEAGGAGLKTDGDWEKFRTDNFCFFRDFTVEGLKEKYKEME
ncbi:hypothetical protein SO694_00072049 [Aureococcus anophagefferens]|uniref:Uncharacterized protein n=1 Tax=Aureococcus anophagefferens TaxID=44056 RepID=A0ABR1FIF8_AURAN